MKDFKGRIAIVTGGGTGMGRELVRQLASEGCHVAMCDVSDEAMEQTSKLAGAKAPAGTRISSFVADVSDEAQLRGFARHVSEAHSTKCVHLLFNNAGIAGAGSFVNDEREEWDRTFDVCWKGVYGGCRVFLPMLLAADASHIINTSSVNGFWASIGPTSAHTSYSAAKFAVKGFSEALVNDFRLHAPHVKVSVVMPGHIGTSIVANSSRYFGRDPKELTTEQLADVRERMAEQGMETQGVTDDQIRQGLHMIGEVFRDAAPMTAEAAATVILDGVREERWRILVGDDAHVLDEMVRERPEEAYEVAFMEEFIKRANWLLGSLGEQNP